MYNYNTSNIKLGIIDVILHDKKILILNSKYHNIIKKFYYDSAYGERLDDRLLLDSKKGLIVFQNNMILYNIDQEMRNVQLFKNYGKYLETVNIDIPGAYLIKFEEAAILFKEIDNKNIKIFKISNYGIFNRKAMLCNHIYLMIFSVKQILVNEIIYGNKINMKFVFEFDVNIYGKYIHKHQSRDNDKQYYIMFEHECVLYNIINNKSMLL